MLGNKPEGHGPASVEEVKKLTFNQWWAKNKDALQLGGPAPKTIAYIIWLEAQKNA